MLFGTLVPIVATLPEVAGEALRLDGAQPFVLDLIQAAIVGVASIWFVRRYGLLAFVVGLAINYVMRATPWTFNAADWFAWRVAITTGLTLGVAAWGFRNVLGRQSILAEPDLEA